MAALEQSKLIGKTGLWHAGNGLAFGVIVKDVKESWGRTRYLIEPLDGNGETWTENLTLPRG